MDNKYTMTISWPIVDKLGVKLYDKVSAVIAELVANSYDADATNVVIEAPMGVYLATKTGGVITDKGLEIRVIDNGNGMTPEEVNKFYLRVGEERRDDPDRGDISPKYKRRVMGRKGVGKLAPFGICREIEIITSGGSKITNTVEGVERTGYRTAHFILNRDDLLENEDPNYHPKVGSEDGVLKENTSTEIILKNFSYRLVPNQDIFIRQLAQRFGLPAKNWKIVTQDTNKNPEDENYQKIVGQFDHEFHILDDTEIKFFGPEGPNFSCKYNDAFSVKLPKNAKEKIEAGFHYEGRFYPVTGWMAYSKAPYKDELMAGIRIYCRGKIVAQTAIFNQGAGFSGEYSIRSYLVGALNADWLDEEDDLILTDRRDILWSDNLGIQFQEWGQKAIKIIGKISRKPVRKNNLQIFYEVGRVEEKLVEAFPAKEELEIRNSAEKLAKKFGSIMKEEEAKNPKIAEMIIDLCITFGPHITLDENLEQALEPNQPLEVISKILKLSHIAEIISFGRTAQKRLEIIEKVERLIDNPDTAEHNLQEIIEYAPWIINPQWAPITANQELRTLRKRFESFYEQETQSKIYLGEFRETRRRPDFVLDDYNGLQIVEIKKPKHSLTDPEMNRIATYHKLMERFLDDNKDFKKLYHGGFHITIVCDALSLSEVYREAFDSYCDKNKWTRISWDEFILRTRRMHKSFISARETKGDR